LRTISLKLNETLDEKLIEIARKQGISKSRVIRDAVIAYIMENKNISSESCFNLARDLLGSVDGPYDLSFNKKHMENFGK
jgi:predicted DNA-binding protein